MTQVNLVDIVSRIQDHFRDLALSDPGTILEDSATDDGTYRDDNPRVRELVDRMTNPLSSPDAERIRAEYFESGPLQALLERDDVTEIIVNGPQSIWYECAGRLRMWEDIFLSDLTYRNFIQRVCRDAGVQLSLDCPFTDGHWRNFRLHLISPPASPHAALTLRRHPSSPWRLQDLQDRAWAPLDAMICLRQLIERKQNFLIVGGTGSGKTSVLNACLQELQPHERTVVIEDTSELTVPNRSSTKLLTRRDSTGHLRDIDQAELLKQSLRMRPDRLVMGEIRGNEAKDLLMAFATGHAGCMGTLHAETARQALLRLEMLIQLGAAQWSQQAVRTLVLLSLHAIVVVQRAADGQRKLEGIYRLASLEDIGFLLEKIV
ncbi:MAG: Flp pilus assembly complex ATPase component TadA [Bdellovibrionaceae bacterium]|nr:Flp pilus assembly complex ATPase component TadA [Pseudobdellovibrionaceae bacterium]